VVRLAFITDSGIIGATLCGINDLHGYAVHLFSVLRDLCESFLHKIPIYTPNLRPIIEGKTNFWLVFGRLISGILGEFWVNFWGWGIFWEKTLYNSYVFF
jgi:hypothetical protein